MIKATVIITILMLVNGVTNTVSSAIDINSMKDINMGTTIMALRYKDGVIVAADTRTSVSGYVSNRFATKVTFILDPHHDDFYSFPSNNETNNNPNGNDVEKMPLNECLGSTCCVCRSGSAADTLYLAGKTREELITRQLLQNGNKPTVTNAAHVFHNFLMEKPNLSCSLICAGYDHILKRGIIYSIANGGSMMEEPIWAVGGSGSTYILGYLDMNYPINPVKSKIQDILLNEKDAIDFVRKAIHVAMSRDGSSGGFVRLYVIDRNGKRSDLETSSTEEQKYPTIPTHRQPFVSSTRRRTSVSLENFAPVPPT